MVSIRKAKQGFARRQRGATSFDRFMSSVINGKDPMARAIVGAVLFVSAFSLYWIFTVPATDGTGGLSAGLLNRQRRRRPSKPHPMLQNKSGNKLGDRFDSFAQDLVKKLDCEKLFRDTLKEYNLYDQADEGEDENNRRRLDEAEMGSPDAPLMDDFNAGMGGDYVNTNALHLFCLAAMPDEPPTAIVQNIKCDASGDKRQTILDLWSSAQSQMDLDLIRKTLSLAKEMEGQTLLDKSYNLWAPELDNGFSFMMRALNNNDNDNHVSSKNEAKGNPIGTNSVERGGLWNLYENLGVGKLFVDVGSCLGLTTLAVAQRYPGTKVVSIEPAQPNWLLQQINLRCNMEHDELRHVKSVMSGVGPNSEDEDYILDRFLWRPSATTSTRSWTPKDERKEDDVDLSVRLRRLESILAEAGVFDASTIDVLNLDCEGCEYNVVPELSQVQFDAIPTILGGVHWGYIPTSKLPSSERGRKTHERLCVHEQIAKSAKECCDVPDLEVKSQSPGEVLKRAKVPSGSGDEALAHPITVADLAGDLCDDFDTWSEEHMLSDIPDDYNWFELTGQAE